MDTILGDAFDLASSLVTTVPVLLSGLNDVGWCVRSSPLGRRGGRAHGPERMVTVAIVGSSSMRAPSGMEVGALA